MLKKFNLILVYSPFIFIIYFLTQSDYSNWPRVNSISLLCFAFILLLPSYLVQLCSWFYMLSESSFNIKFKLIFVTSTRTVLTKYVPGKVMSILGRASLLAEKLDGSVKTIGQISLIQQLLTLLSGILWGSFTGYYFFDKLWVTSAQIILLSVPILLWVMNTKIVKLEIPKFGAFFRLIQSYSLSFYIKNQLLLLLQWMLSGIAFYVFVGSFYPNEQNMSLLFIYPLAVNISMIIFFIPGGLGIREGVLIFFLKLIGFSLIDATALAFSYRLVNLLFEFLLFINSYLFKKSLPETKSK